MNAKICYIFGAGEYTPCLIKPTDDDIVIAADGGFDFLEEIGLRVDYVLGDFDSVKSSHLPSNCVRYPTKKNDTDMMLAIKLGLDKGYTEFRIYGGLGGRLDHTLGNIQALTYLSHHGAAGTLIGNDYSLRVITDSTIYFAEDLPENRPGNLCSVFSLSDNCTDVVIRGLEYELEGTTLTNSFPLGISNEFTGRNSHISVQSGTLAVLWQH